jgi:hypothetical protein
MVVAAFPRCSTRLSYSSAHGIFSLDRNHHFMTSCYANTHCRHIFVSVGLIFSLRAN